MSPSSMSPSNPPPSNPSPRNLSPGDPSLGNPSPGDPSRGNPVDLDRLDLDEVKRFLARRWTLIVATAIACLVIAAIVCFSVTPVFTATSQILLDPRKQHIFGQDAVSQDSSLDSSIVDSQIPIILSTKLLAKVVIKENLAEDPEFASAAKAGFLDRIFGLFRSARPKSADVPSFDGIDPSLAPVILHLFNKIDVARIAKSYVLSISVSSRDAAKASRLANTLAQTYVEDQVDVHAKSVQQAATFFEDRLGSLRDQVRQSERAVAEFRKAHGLTTTVMDGGKVTVSEQQLQTLNAQLAQTTTDTAEKLARYQQAAHFVSAGANLDTLPEIVRSPTIVQLRTQQADLVRRDSDLSAMYGPQYPAITQIHAQKAGFDRAIATEIRRIATSLKNEYDIAKVREDALRKTIARLGDLSGGDNEEGVTLRELERTNLANKALFENFLNRAKLTQEQSSFEEPDARLISPALEPSSPSSPKTKLILPVAGIAGLLLGLGLAAGLDLTRRRKVASTPPRADAFILGRVPEIAGYRGERVDCEAYVADHPDSEFARNLALIAGKLAGRPDAGEGRAVLVAPLSRGEGATSLVLGLAAADAGHRVLVIDGDIRGRGLTRALGLTDSVGLAEVVAGACSANKAIARRPRFAVLPAGQGPLDVVAARQRLQGFLAEARGRYGLILVDAPAADAGGDPQALADLVDAVALVGSWDHLMRASFVTAIDAFADRPNFAGIILNRTDSSEPMDFALAG